jgi:formylglycine-generating enzyme required for sulfatase activity
MLLDRDPPRFPADWAVAWGEDAYGLWQAFEIAGVRQVMRWIPPGRFLMGSSKDEPERSDNETLHQVTLSQGYWLAETACTQALWQAVTGVNPSRFKQDAENPVESICWDDCVAFVGQVKARLDGGLVLRLPTEAEWEYACRAGTDTPFSFGAELDTGKANYDGGYPYAGGARGKYREQTVPVHDFRPNPWGLYQMHGNVWEWCADGYGDYPGGPVLDPAGPAQARGCVLRGGAWYDGGRELRSAYRARYVPGYRYDGTGLRLAGGC